MIIGPVVSSHLEREEGERERERDRERERMRYLGEGGMHDNWAWYPPTPLPPTLASPGSCNTVTRYHDAGPGARNSTGAGARSGARRHGGGVYMSDKGLGNIIHILLLT